MAVPATAGSRAIMIGIALGIIAQSFRIITGRETIYFRRFMNKYISILLGNP